MTEPLLVLLVCLPVIVVMAGSVQSFSHFRSFVLFRKVVGLGLFCSWPPWGPGARRSGDGHDLGQPVHL